MDTAYVAVENREQFEQLRLLSTCAVTMQLKLKALSSNFVLGALDFKIIIKRFLRK